MNKITSAFAAFRDSYYFWDWITLICVFVSVFGFLMLLISLLGLPGRIAVARKHPEAQAVYALGWVGFLAVVPWIQAFVWAFKPTDVIDIRRLPDEQKKAEGEELEQLRAYAYSNWRRHEKEAPKEAPTPPLPTDEQA